MYDLTVAHVDGYVSDAAASLIEEKVACLNASEINRCTAAGL